MKIKLNKLTRAQTTLMNTNGELKFYPGQDVFLIDFKQDKIKAVLRYETDGLAKKLVLPVGEKKDSIINFLNIVFEGSPIK